MTATTTVGVLPERVDFGQHDRARALLARDGAVIVTGLEPTTDDLVLAAARLLGDRLRQVFPPRVRVSRDGSPVHLHADSFDLVVDTGNGPVRRRDPDEDYVLVQCVAEPASGGASFLADAYLFVDEVADPELVDFLTRYDVDIYGAWAGIRGVPPVPRVAKHVEFTRGGRRVVRCNEGAAPLHRDPDGDHVQAMLRRLGDAVIALESGLPRFSLAQGDILAVDNYRCWHGRDAHAGARRVHILTTLSADAL